MRTTAKAWPGMAGACAVAILLVQVAAQPAEDVERPAGHDAGRAYLTFERRYHLKVGDKGEDTFDVSTERPACGESAWVFDHARVEFLARRFADAQIVALPEAGCFDCAPLTVRWYHEPTGRLTYRLHVHRRPVAGDCSADAGAR